jgi:hypothetical protein
MVVLAVALVVWNGTLSGGSGAHVLAALPSAHAADSARAWLRAPMTARGRRLRPAGLGRLRSPVSIRRGPHHGQPVYARSLGMGCTVTPAAVRN